MSALGPVWKGAENLAPTWIRSPDGPAQSESLYRLRQPCSLLINVYNQITAVITTKFLYLFCYMFRHTQASLRMNTLYKHIKVIYLLLMKNWDLSLQTFE